MGEGERQQLDEAIEHIGLLISVDPGPKANAVFAAARAWFERQDAALVQSEGLVREWQPIDTAPKDRDILLHGMDQTFVGYWEPSTAPDLVAHDGHRTPGREWCWKAVEGSTLHKEAVTHWMDVPVPPSAVLESI